MMIEDSRRWRWWTWDGDDDDSDREDGYDDDDSDREDGDDEHEMMNMRWSKWMLECWYICYDNEHICRIIHSIIYRQQQYSSLTWPNSCRWSPWFQKPNTWQPEQTERKFKRQEHSSIKTTSAHSGVHIYASADADTDAYLHQFSQSRPAVIKHCGRVIANTTASRGDATRGGSRSS